MAFDSNTYLQDDLQPRRGQRLIELTLGFHALIDAEDYERVIQHRWHAHLARSKVYARNRAVGLLHRFITGAPDGSVVDHLNGKGLDCRRRNLAVCGFDKNAQQAEYAIGVTGFRGVTLTSNGRFRARIQWRGAEYNLGRFESAEEAAAAYDRKAKELFGPFAWTNVKAERCGVRHVELADIPF